MAEDQVEDLALLDRRFLLRAIELSAEQVRSGRGGPFGAIIVRAGAVVAEGCNEVTASFDPTAHAEVVAIRRACRSAGDFSLAGATIYASCEPCPMCLAAIYWARLDRLVFANTRAEAAAIGFDDALIYDEIPKPVLGRRLPTLHLPLPKGADAFGDWARKPDKIAY
jgi:tRNA(Arg) A34 adenosine deaminase TadA